MKLQLVKATTDSSQIIFIQDSSSTTGAGLTGLAYDTASLVCYYVRPGSAAAALTLATQTVTGGHSDGGFVEIDSTNMPGVYRLDLSDAILATGVDTVVVMLKGAADMAPLVLEIQLVTFDLNIDPWAVQIPDSVPAKGTLPTREQAVYMINQYLQERGVSGLTLTTYKVDGTTGLMTFTLDDASNPTSHHRAT